MAGAVLLSMHCRRPQTWFLVQC